MILGALQPLRWLPLVSIFCFSVADAAGVSCAETAFPSCEQLAKAPIDASKDPGVGIGTRPDGGAVFNPFAITTLSTNDKIRQAKLSSELRALGKPSTPGELKRFTEQKEKVRAVAIAVVANGISEANWTAEQKVMIQRLRTVQINAGFTDLPECSQMVVAGYPNAAYAAETHSLNVCPALMRMTESQFMLALGHELGHVVQSCFATSPLYSYKPEDFNDGPISECSATLLYDSSSEDGGGTHRPDVDPYLNILRGTKGQETGFSVGPLSSEAVDKLKNCKSLVPVKDAYVAKAQIFSKTDACIEKLNAGAYRDAKAKGDFQRSVVAGGETESSIRDRNKPQCFELTGEDFADSFATKVVAMAATGSRGLGKPEGRPWNASDIKSAMLFQKSFACAEKVTKTSEDNHPVADHRLRTYLNDPRLSSKLGCELPKSPDLCPLEIANGGGALKAPVQSPSGKSRGVK